MHMKELLEKHKKGSAESNVYAMLFNIYTCLRLSFSLLAKSIAFVLWQYYIKRWVNYVTQGE